MSYKKVKIIFLISLLILLSINVSAIWVDWVNCHDLLERNVITPQSVFNGTEDICFIGGGFTGSEYTLVLRDPVQKLERTFTPNCFNKSFTKLPSFGSWNR